MAAEMVRKQRKASFIDKHCDQYGLKIVTRGPKGNVDSVVCRFCVTFGREDDNGDCGVGNNNGSARKRKRTTNAKYFSSFRTTDNYKTHLETQHPSKWSERQKINHESDAIANFFDMDVPFTNTLTHISISRNLSLFL